MKKIKNPHPGFQVNIILVKFWRSSGRHSVCSRSLPEKPVERILGAPTDMPLKLLYRSEFEFNFERKVYIGWWNFFCNGYQGFAFFPVGSVLYTRSRSPKVRDGNKTKVENLSPIRILLTILITKPYEGFDVIDKTLAESGNGRMSGIKVESKFMVLRSGNRDEGDIAQIGSQHESKMK